MPKNTLQETEQLTDAMYYILLSLVEPRHGYAIMKYIAELSNHTIHMGPGTLYTLLKKLSNANWIMQTSTDDRTKTYQITETGLQILRTEIKRRKHMVEDGIRVLKEAGYEK
ncbi:PadR family transcriptional regulator [Erysipelotrichaceae bacterium HCN-30851]